jgi:hypothetical protein
VADHVIGVLAGGQRAESPAATVKATDVSASTSDVFVFVKVKSIDCGVTVIVHLGESSLKFQLPPAGISTVPTAEPLATLLTCQSHGVAEPAVVDVVILPPTLAVQPVKAADVMSARVCVAGTYMVNGELVHEIVQTTPRGAVAESLKSVEIPLNVDLAVSPMGVMNGETGLLPDEVVRVGVAKAGVVTTTTATSKTRAATTAPLRVCMTYVLSAYRAARHARVVEFLRYVNARENQEDQDLSTEARYAALDTGLRSGP